MKKTFTVKIELEGTDEQTLQHDMESFVSIENYHCERQNSINTTKVVGWTLLSPEKSA